MDNQRTESCGSRSEEDFLQCPANLNFLQPSKKRCGNTYKKYLEEGSIPRSTRYKYDQVKTSSSNHTNREVYSQNEVTPMEEDLIPAYPCSSVGLVGETISNLHTSQTCTVTPMEEDLIPAYPCSSVGLVKESIYSLHTSQTCTNNQTEVYPNSSMDELTSPDFVLDEEPSSNVGQSSCDLNSLHMINETEECPTSLLVDATTLPPVEPATRVFDDSHTDNDRETLENSFQEKLLDELPTISKGETMLLLQSFFMKHKLTETSINDLLILLNLMLGKSVLPSSKYLFRKFFSKTLYNSNLTHVCSICSTIVAEQKGKEIWCPKCKVAINKKDNFYYTVPIAPQLQTLLKLNPNLFEASKNCDKPVPEVLSDITDSRMYLKFKSNLKANNTSNTLSFLFTTDGAKLYKSSQSTMWPLMMVLNELPPRDRFKNVILAGLWCGKNPKMEIFLSSFAQEMQSLGNNGFTCKNPKGDTVEFKVFAICCCPDSPARAKILNVKSYNGYFGCSWCYHPGHQLPLEQCGTSKKKIVRYTETETFNKLRTEKEILRDMSESHTFQRVVNGVKGPSPLINLPFFNIARGVTPDYMHCVLLGVVSQITDLWLTSSKEPYYIGSPANVALVNKHLETIQCPVEVHRRPRPISMSRFWKASEWRTWLLFYSIPCLQNVLPRKYIVHFALLCNAIYALLENTIEVNELEEIETMLLRFVLGVQTLYGNKQMVSNVHSLLHLVQSVLNWGPLWAHSSFTFENAIGKMQSLVKGTQFAPQQITKKYLMIHSFSNLFKSHENNVSPEIVSCLMNMGQELNPKANVTCPIRLLGKGYPKDLTVSEHDLLFEHNIDVHGTNLTFFNRIVVNNIIYHSVEYKKAPRQNNTYVEIQGHGICQIKDIFRVENSGNFSNFVKFVKLDVQERYFLTYLSPIVKTNPPMISPVSKIVQKMFEINTADCKYIAKFPNMYEQGGYM